MWEQIIVMVLLWAVFVKSSEADVHATGRMVRPPSGIPYKSCGSKCQRLGVIIIKLQSIGCVTSSQQQDLAITHGVASKLSTKTVPLLFHCMIHFSNLHHLYRVRRKPRKFVLCGILQCNQSIDFSC